MMWILDPRIAVMVHHRGRPVGVVICIPDLNPLMRATRSRFGLATPWHFLRFRLARRRAVIVFYSVVRDLHGRGLNGAMLHKVTTALKAAGYTRLGITWIADVNTGSLRQMEKLGARPLHRLHLYRKPLGPAA
jgi:GNAT superfamily N-acetyltransferase